jgi:hypothetical protein
MGVTTIRNPLWRFPRFSKKRCVVETEKSHVPRRMSSRWVRFWLKLGIGLTIVVWLLLIVWVVPVS